MCILYHPVVNFENAQSALRLKSELFQNLLRGITKKPTKKGDGLFGKRKTAPKKMRKRRDFRKRKTKRLSLFQRLPNLPLSLFSHDSESLRFTLNKFGLSSESLCI
jgi:hypothetical protein